MSITMAQKSTVTAANSVAERPQIHPQEPPYTANLAPNHDLYEQYRQITSRYTNENTKLIGLNVLANKDKNTVRIDSIQKAADKLTSQRYLAIANFVKNNPDKEISALLLVDEIPNISKPILDSITKNITPEVLNSKYGKELQKLLKLRENE